MTRKEYITLATMLRGGVWHRSMIEACARLVCQRKVSWEEVMAAQDKWNPPEEGGLTSRGRCAMLVDSTREGSEDGG